MTNGYFVGPKRKLVKENENNASPAKVPFCKYGNFVPASSASSPDEYEENSKADEDNKETKLPLPINSSSDDCQIVSESFSKQKESNTIGNDDNNYFISVYKFNFVKLTHYND